MLYLCVFEIIKINLSQLGYQQIAKDQPLPNLQRTPSQTLRYVKC